MRETNETPDAFAEKLTALFSDIPVPAALEPDNIAETLRRNARPRVVSRRRAAAIAAMAALVIGLGALSAVAALRLRAQKQAVSESAYSMTESAQTADEAVPYGAAGGAAPAADHGTASGANTDDTLLTSGAADTSTGSGADTAADTSNANNAKNPNDDRKYDDCLEGCHGDVHVPGCPHYGEESGQ